LSTGTRQFGCVSGAFGGLASTVQQRIVVRHDALGQPPIGLGLGAVGPFLHSREARRRVERRVCPPPLQRGQQIEVSL
jgi:hypothetical protein